ncbi:hypothetical protein LPB03_01000 [Polaribacter vadi]|uniref:Uncharacterized protein n=1 Tax=Polaribacter vadi TaxID=1774273 RepID=A0A1B8U138_9FLAO|nr:hypothetical protein [Polaribacter vadi]AOW16122.1 hypothetical protein LPB03_01000 [Polaribacter vadi]OBY65552.1 hypothetical protein LPB3_04110 [Polaribacter vadi]
MKNYLLIITYFLLTNTYSQSKDTIYLLINKNDSLIKKQVASITNEYEGYKIIDKKKLITDTKRSSDIGGDDIQYERFDSFSFSFNRKNDILISKSYLANLNLITDREYFLNLKKKGDNFDTLGFTYFFIEKTNCENKFILRKVSPVTFE